MIKLILTLTLLPFALYTFSQKELKQYIKQTISPISTIEPDSANFSDLEVIGRAVEDARIVMLGEQDHGDAPTFLAKTRLIKYLHEKKGFNVLAFEGDFFALNYGWSELPKEKSLMDSFLMKNIYMIWTRCNTCRELFYSYVPETYKTSKPLLIAGIDNQMSSSYSSQFLSIKLDSMLKRLNLPITKQANYHTVISIIDSLKYPSAMHKDPGYYKLCDRYLNQIRSELTEQKGNDMASVLVDNLIQENIEFATSNNYLRSANARDSQMANNIKWLSETRFRDQKIIVWAANAHIAKYADQAASNTAGKWSRMGSFLAKDSLFIYKTYILGFTSYQGTAGRINLNTYKITKPRPNGFENWIPPSYQYAFVDFNGFTGPHMPFYMKALGHNTFIQEDWTQIFDGIFYIKDMYPCKQLSGTEN